tara:strand:+ start:194 stop:901 length:708 start_codon:yes stop_codon:yes gene_type:complete
MGIFNWLFGKKETPLRKEVELKEIVSIFEENFGKQNVRLKSSEEVEQENNEITIRRSFWNGDFITYKEDEECNRNFLWEEETIKGVHSLSSGKGKHGITRKYYGNGQIKIESKYDHDKVIYHKCWDRDGNKIEFKEDFLDWKNDMKSIKNEDELKKIDGLYYYEDYPLDGYLHSEEKLEEDWVRTTENLIINGKIIQTRVDDIKGDNEEIKKVSKKYFNIEGHEVDYDTWIGSER